MGNGLDGQEMCYGEGTVGITPKAVKGLPVRCVEVASLHSRMGAGTWDTGIGLAAESAALDGELQAAHGKLGNVGCHCPLCMYPHVPWGQLFGLGVQDPVSQPVVCVPVHCVPSSEGVWWMEEPWTRPQSATIICAWGISPAPPSQAWAPPHSVCHPKKQCPPAQEVMESCDSLGEEPFYHIQNFPGHSPSCSLGSCSWSQRVEI